ncbi:hypothetical protein K504DRAFT_500807 [Pleomassaria siparia CBS 279.74]|uniref:Uncharacterized protein n=1 Tax=Pleomassaria siparia CBS 279.74 TaxID=1314801 RepID=A0A6G1KDK8_9PLEO|nr:hypothetical protein K504DRAFT_500807 [Pleomassaria siparia CBS 279.74]
MANIYRDAYFTIVAADGTDAQSGIPGMSRHSSRTSIPPLLHFNAFSLTANFASLNSTERLPSTSNFAAVIHGCVISRFRFRFKHPHAPGMEFRYPLPIAKLASEQPKPDLQSIHLRFNSMVCNFTFREEELGSPFPQGSLYTAKEVWAGFMHDMQTPALEENLDLLACEVVVIISTGFVNINRERLVEKGELNRVEDVVPEVAHFSQIIDAGDVYHFYNVMWLAWEDEIAYRRGIGRVWKPVWNQQELKPMEINHSRLTYWADKYLERNSLRILISNLAATHKPSLAMYNSPTPCSPD